MHSTNLFNCDPQSVGIFQSASSSTTPRLLTFKAYLFQYCWYNTDKDMIECKFCTYSIPSSRRSDFFVHIRNVHKTEIHESDLPPEQIEDCGTKICRKLFGFNHQQLWCKGQEFSEYFFMSNNITPKKQKISIIALAFKN